jgi:hypothetical protein
VPAGVGVAVGAGVAGGWGVGLGVLTGDDVAVGTGVLGGVGFGVLTGDDVAVGAGVAGGWGVGLGVLTGHDVAVGTGALRTCFFNLDGAVVRRLAWAGGVAAVRKVNSIAVTPNRRGVKPKRPFILSPPEESLRRHNTTSWTALVYRERCCRPARRCRLDERDVCRIETERESRYMVRPARQLGRTLPPVDPSKRRDKLLTRCGKRCQQDY